MTPKIYRSTDLVHWEIIAQPVSADWDLYGDVPVGGIWGRYTVYHDVSTGTSLDAEPATMPCTLQQRGVEFGVEEDTGDDVDYPKAPEYLTITASNMTAGGVIEVWLDALDSAQKVAEATIEGTGDWDTYATFSTDIASASGQHDVFLKFVGASPIDELFRLRSMELSARLVSTAITDENLPAASSLGQNYPNPFNPTTTIHFDLPQTADVQLDVFNLLGQKVMTLVNGTMQAGVHQVNFNAQNLASGLYIYRIQAADFVSTKQMMLIK